MLVIFSSKNTNPLMILIFFHTSIENHHLIKNLLQFETLEDPHLSAYQFQVESILYLSPDTKICNNGYH